MSLRNIGLWPVRPARHFVRCFGVQRSATPLGTQIKNLCSVAGIAPPAQHRGRVSGFRMKRAVL